jgi:DNA-damage-inducible protein J
MTATTVTIRVDSEDKAAASEIAEYFGFDLSSVTRAFYKQMIREHRIPLDLTMQEPNAQSLAAIKEADEFFASGATARFNTAEDMIANLEA